jgi:NADPH-dependent 2,4-dienoyl-CoA reductase/sulfur reductase-like enzyme
LKSDILIVGAGPAGLAAAASASLSDVQVDIIDDNFCSGGQIWRGGAQAHHDPRAGHLHQILSNRKNVRFHFETRVVNINSGFALLAESAENSTMFECNKLILATGARELLLPFPGWTLPGVFGAGGLQALAKNGFPVQGKRIVVAGSGPLLLAVAASLIERGAIVSHILEQTTWQQLGRFAVSLLATPDKLRQAWQLRKVLRDVAYISDSYVLSAQGNTNLNAVMASMQGKQTTLDCDYLACSYGLLPNIDLARALGCAIREERNCAKVQVNQWQQSSVDQLYCVGESTGIGGVDLALAEGTIAGFSATGCLVQAQAGFGERHRWRAFSQHLQRTFDSRTELRHLCTPETLVCRCEDVSHAQLQAHDSWRSAKLHTRCGMGACQGRICGAASHFLYGWNRDGGRLPVMNPRIGSLCRLDESM